MNNSIYNAPILMAFAGFQYEPVSLDVNKSALLVIY